MSQEQQQQKQSRRTLCGRGLGQVAGVVEAVGAVTIFGHFSVSFTVLLLYVFAAAKAINNESSLPAGFPFNVFTVMSNATGQQQLQPNQLQLQQQQN